MSGPLSKESAPEDQHNSTKISSQEQFLLIELGHLVLHHDLALYLPIHPTLRQAPCHHSL